MYHQYLDPATLVKPVPSQTGIQKAKHLGLQSQRFLGYDHQSDNAKSNVDKIQQQDRTYLTQEEWSKSKYADYNWTQVLLENCPDDIQRVDTKDLSVQDFINRFERPHKPVVIKGIPQEWKGGQNFWTFNSMYENFKETEFKIGEDDKGKQLRSKLQYFLEYMIHNKDDSPLYLFESSLEDMKDAREIINHYKPPQYFRDDLFKFVGQQNRPPYRWMLMGPERSGTTVHIDPLMTSAWNTSLAGHKRWVLFPPHIPKSIVKGKNYRPQGEDDQAINYFCQILPQIAMREGKANLGMIECIQYPGETIFVPGGWWHAVINVTDTIAMTQNFMSHINFNYVWRSVRKERKKFATKLLESFEQHEPLMAQHALKVNKNDGFVLYKDKMKNKEKFLKLKDEEIKNLDLECIETIKKQRKLSTDSSSGSSSSSSSSQSSSSQGSQSENSDDDIKTEDTFKNKQKHENSQKTKTNK